jgi:putative membrane protein
MRSSFSIHARAACILSLIALPACAVLQGPGDQPLTDRDIAAIFLAANNTDVSYAQVAMTPGRTTNTEVLGFANRMLSDHGGLNKAALDL